MLLVFHLYIHFYHFIEHSWFTISRTSWNAYLIESGIRYRPLELPREKNGDFHFPGRINKQAKYWKFPDEKSLAARFLSSTRELWWNIPINGSPVKGQGWSRELVHKGLLENRDMRELHTHTHTYKLQRSFLWSTARNFVLSFQLSESRQTSW